MIRRRPHRDPPGMGDAFWDERKRVSERRMAEFDRLPAAVREVMHSTCNLNDALALRHHGVRTFAEAERLIAVTGLLQAEARASGTVARVRVPAGAEQRLQRRRRP